MLEARSSELLEGPRCPQQREGEDHAPAQAGIVTVNCGGGAEGT